MREFAKFLIWALVIVGGVLGALYYVVFDVWEIPADYPALSVSIEPTLSAGDIIIALKHSTLKEGQLLRCDDPEYPGRHIVGRLSASAGETIELAGSSVSVDGKKASTVRACDQSKTLLDPATQSEEKLTCAIEDMAGVEHMLLRSQSRQAPGAKKLVEPGHIYIVSDNRLLHLDSRDVGEVEPAACRQIVARLWGTTGFFDASRRFTFIW